MSTTKRKAEEIQEEKQRQPKKKTGAKRSKGKAIGLLLLTGVLVASPIVGAKAYYSHQETTRVHDLISNYREEDYTILPTNVVTNRSYDITYASGEKLNKALVEEGINCIRINGQFYTPDGSNMAIISYRVTYIEQTNPIKVTTEGQTIYMAPSGYSLYGETAYKYITEEVTKIVPVSTNYDYITFPNSVAVEMLAEPQIFTTLPYSMIENSTLICDVPDGATLNESDECNASLTLVPKKH